MIRHCLIPRRIVGQLGYVQTQFLRDESGEIPGYCPPVLYQLRKGDARVPQERELQRHAQLVPSPPSRADDLDIGRLEGERKSALSAKSGSVRVDLAVRQISK